MNKIFKTIWNRARRSYVAVNEAVCGAAQADGRSVYGTTVKVRRATGKVFALSAVALAVMQASGSEISGIYENLDLTGETIIDLGEVKTKNYQYCEEYDKFGGNKSPGTVADPRPDLIESSINRYPQSYIPGFNPQAYSANFVIENNKKLTVTDQLNIDKANTIFKVQLRYAYAITHGAGGDKSYTWAAGYCPNCQITQSISASLTNEGGIVDVGELVLENPENTYTQNSGETDIDKVTGDGSVIINDGTLSTNAGVLIDIAEAKAAQIDAKELFAPTTAITVSSLAAGEKSHVSGISATGDQFTINGGTLNIKGTYEQSIANQAETLLKDYYGQNINVTFDEVVADQTLDLTNGYTTAVLKSIYDENGRSDVLFHTLNWNAQNADLTIGSGDMAESIGVKNIDNARQVTVTNGKTFAILGDGAGSSVNGTFVADNGNLVFGAEGLTSGGTVNSVTMRNNASVTVANGIFDMTSVTGNGNFTVAQGATANFDNHTIDGTFSNVGNLNVDGALTFAVGSTFTSSGNLTTNQDNVFQNVTPSVIDPLKVIGVAAQMPEEVQTVAAELFRKYVPGEVADALAQHASFTDGLVTITGVNLTETQVADLTQAFKEKLSLTDFLAESNAFPVAFI